MQKAFLSLFHDGQNLDLYPQSHNDCVRVSIAVIKTLKKDSLEKKGFFVDYNFRYLSITEGSQGCNLRQELEQRPQKNTAN